MTPEQFEILIASLDSIAQVLSVINAAICFVGIVLIFKKFV